MTVAEICVSGYLGVGLLAAVLIWTNLVASKRQDHKTEKPAQDIVERRPFREQKTKPSKSHL